jgi:flavin reductase (DIM6/NTAB) family NADH-FMN oxidoreductase RutF
MTDLQRQAPDTTRRSEAASGLLSHFWTPIVAVTSAHAGVRSGQIAVSVHGASIVPQRPRLTAALWKRNLTHDLVQRSGVFAVHLLREDQDEVVYRLGLVSGRHGDKLAGIVRGDGVSGCPLLADYLAVYECRVLNAMDGGDMTVFLGEVIAMDGGDGAPLWWRALRPRMPAEQAAAWERKIAGDIADSLRTMDAIASPAKQPLEQPAGEVEHHRRAVRADGG